jgi:predicted TIM-barrel fold metal-dependent hydrolase
MHSALTIEEVLVKHPKLRVYIMHAGYPMIDDLLALLYPHPQVYVDIGVIVYTQPRPAFYRYLQAIVHAGFANRVMFGSDQIVWPGSHSHVLSSPRPSPSRGSMMSDPRARPSRTVTRDGNPPIQYTL